MLKVVMRCLIEVTTALSKNGIVRKGSIIVVLQPEVTLIHCVGLQAA